jgi:transcription elongation GreA/GreB family factor
MGSLVYTSNGRFFISASAGKIEAGGESYYAVSNESPIALKLIGRKAGDNIILNNVVYTIEKIC